MFLAYLDLFWGLLGSFQGFRPLWAYFGGFWGLFRRVIGKLSVFGGLNMGLFLGVLWLILCLLWPFLGALGAIWGCLESFGGGGWGGYLENCRKAHAEKIPHSIVHHHHDHRSQIPGNVHVLRMHHTYLSNQKPESVTNWSPCKYYKTQLFITTERQSLPRGYHSTLWIHEVQPRKVLHKKVCWLSCPHQIRS